MNDQSRQKSSVTSGERTDLIQRLRDLLGLPSVMAFDEVVAQVEDRWQTMIAAHQEREAQFHKRCAALEASPSAREEAPHNEDAEEVLRVAKGLLEALNGRYPHAAVQEFQQLGPQVMRDLVAIAEVPAAEFPDPDAPEEWTPGQRAKMQADFDEWQSKREAPAAERVRLEDASRDTHYMRVAVAAWEKSQAELDWQKVLVAQLEEKVAAYERMVPAYKGRAETAEEALAESEQTIATLRAALEEIADQRVCEDEPDKCYMDSGPYCGKHGDDSWATKIARAALARPSDAPTGAPTP